MVLIIFMSLLIQIVFGYSEQDIINALNNNEIAFHQSSRVLQQELFENKPVWEPLKITFEFEEPELGLGDSYLYRLMQIMQTFFEQHLFVRRNDQQMILRFQECLNVNLPNKLLNTSIPFHQVFLITVINDIEKEYIFKCAPCAMLPDNSRPAVMLMTVNSYIIKQQLDEYNFELNLKKLIHEFIQGTALLRPLIQYYSEVQTGIKYLEKPLQYYDPSHDVMTTPRLMELVQQFFNCTTAKGLKMESKADPVRYFFDNDIFHHEIMSYESNLFITNFTFVFLSDTGFYRVGQYDPDNYTDGFNKSCDFYDSSCGSKTQFTEKFCYDDSVTNCDRQGTAISKCIQNYNVGSCPFQRSYLDCRTSQIIEGTMMEFGDGSQCIRGKIMKSDKPDMLPELINTCAKFTCTPDRKIIQFFIGMGNKTDQQLICNETDMYVGGARGYRGFLKCPSNFEEFCSRKSFCQNSCNFNGLCMNKRCYCRGKYYGSACQYICDGVTYKNKCYDECPIGTFMHYNNICLDCPYGCNKCSNYVGNCTDCSYENATIIDGFCDYKMRFIGSQLIIVIGVLTLLIQ